MRAQAAYLDRGLTGPSPDKDLDLLPEGSAKEFIKRGFVAEGFWTPTVEEALTLDSDEIWRRQRGGD